MITCQITVVTNKIFYFYYKKMIKIYNTLIKPSKHVRNSKFILKNSCYSEILLKYYQTVLWLY